MGTPLCAQPDAHRRRAPRPPDHCPAPLHLQTDPNWGNFFYNPATDRIGLLDFGACRSFDKAFVDDYLRLVWAAANNDRATIEEVSVRLGFLTGYESRVMLDAHVDSGLVVGEPFRSSAPFDFRAAGITSRVSRYGSVFAEHRLTPPPNEAYSLHRKLAGAFLICIRMGAVMRSRDLLEEVYFSHNFGPEGGGSSSTEAAGPGAPQAQGQKLE
jgi:aarF domain-containing kinase